MLQYSLVTTAADRYGDFGDIGAACLRMVAKNHGVALDEDAAKRAVSSIRSLPPHADVVPAIERLREARYRLVTLTNSSNAAIAEQMKNSGLGKFFEKELSVEDVGFYKPHAHVYRWAARRVGVDVSECLLVAAHGWDVAGAKLAGAYFGHHEHRDRSIVNAQIGHHERSEATLDVRSAVELVLLSSGDAASS